MALRQLRLCRELRAAGHVCSQKRVARLMRLVVDECAVLTVKDALDGERADAVLVTVPQRIGTTEKGVRNWLVCPDCASRRSWLLLLDDGGLSCRVCCGVPYRSQHLSRGTRLRYRAHGIAQRLGGVDAAGVLRKPLRMRWATHTRLWERIDALQTAAGRSHHPPRADPHLWA